MYSLGICFLRKLLPLLLILTNRKEVQRMVLSKWISHLSLVRRHSPMEASDQSSFLPSATTPLYFLLYNNLYFSSSTICINSYSTIIPRWSTLRSSSVWKVGGKRIETRKETFPRTNCCFCFSFSCQKAEIYLQSAGTAVKKQKLNIPPNTSIAMIQNG